MSSWMPAKISTLEEQQQIAQAKILILCIKNNYQWWNSLLSLAIEGQFLTKTQTADGGARLTFLVKKAFKHSK